jgi:Intein splicing domain
MARTKTQLPLVITAYTSPPSPSLTYRKLAIRPRDVTLLIPVGISTRVLCFGLDDHQVRFRMIRAVIRHPIDEPLYEVTTAVGRSLRVTASHSIFVHQDGGVVRKRGDELAVGDSVVAPRRIPLPGDAPEEIDLLRGLHGTAAAGNIWVRGPAVAEWYTADLGRAPEAPRSRNRARAVARGLSSRTT